MGRKSKLCSRCRWGEPQLIEMTPEQAAWVAGLLEGEGSFVSGRCVGIINALKRRKPNHKDAWVWSVRRRAHIRGIINPVLPWLGERRSIAARKLLAAIEGARDRSDVKYPSLG